jgi:hypothetical protein
MFQERKMLERTISDLEKQLYGSNEVQVETTQADIDLLPSANPEDE